MKNRIAHLLDQITPPPAPSGSAEATMPPEPDQPAAYPLPRGVNMLLPVELGINRDLLITLLTASIQGIHRHKRAMNQPTGSREMAEVEAALQQQMAFRTWARRHPSGYICIALYPVAEADLMDDVDDPGEE
jgi:hypothetical protein